LLFFVSKGLYLQKEGFSLDYFEDLLRANENGLGIGKDAFLRWFEVEYFVV